MTAQAIELEILRGNLPIEIDLSNPRSDDTDCWVYGASIVDLHCKIVCQNCGCMRDCSDL